MKILLGIYKDYDNVLLISKTLEDMGHEVILVYTDSYHDAASYFSRKLDKWGLISGRNRYNKNVKDMLWKGIVEGNPHLALFINPPERVLSLQEIQGLQQLCHSRGVKLVTWLAGTAPPHETIIHMMRCFDYTYSFNEADVQRFKNANISASYLPIGYQEVYEKVDEELRQDIDICFVGSSRKSRIMLLDAVAKFAHNHKLNMKVYGPYWEKQYPWKKWVFHYKYPALFKCIENGYFTPAEVASIYKRSKICLNAHGNGAVSLNPRTFQIMATGSFQLVDEVSHYGEVLPGNHVVVYKDEEDLLNKIDYYLNNNVERMRISTRGMDFVKHNYSINRCLEEILKTVQ